MANLSLGSSMRPGDFHVVLDVNNSKLKMFNYKGLLAWIGCARLHPDSWEKKIGSDVRAVTPHRYLKVSCSEKILMSQFVDQMDLNSATFTGGMEHPDPTSPGRVWFVPEGLPIDRRLPVCYYTLSAIDYKYLRNLTENVWHAGRQVFLTTLQ